MRGRLTWLCVSFSFVLGADPCFVNPGFEEGTDMPTGWGKALHGEGFVLRREPDGGRNGTACISLEGKVSHGDRACFLQTGLPFVPAKGLRLRVWYKGEGTGTGILRVRSVPGVEVPGGEYGTSHFQLPLPETEWTEFVFEMGVPKAAREAEQIRAEVILYQRGEGILKYDDVSVERLTDYQPQLTVVTETTICPRRPENGRTVFQNPPDFWWPSQVNAVEYTLQLSSVPDFTEDKTVTVDGLKHNVYSHSRTLAPGQWFWRVRFVDGEEMASRWLDSWSFTVSPDAVPFPVPSAEEMLGRIPQSHPRVYTTAADLADFRAPLQTSRKAWWEGFSRKLDGYLKQETVREPGGEFADWQRGGLTDDKVKLGQKLRSICGRATGRMQNLAFGYLLSGDERYAAAAVDQAVEMAGWDPDGVTSYRNHDQVFRDIAWKLATTYDWCYGRLTEEQQVKIRSAVMVRGKVLFRDFTEGRTICEYPFDSHGITAYGFLGICAIALAHDEPDADGWFRFVASTYPAIFPPWGGEEGGWAQGCAYWKWSQPFAWWFFDALKSATGVDLYQKAFTRNNGWFKLYMHSPWCDRHHFGDGNHGPPDTADAANLARYAKVYSNPYFQWYADQIAWQSADLFSYWWYADDLLARPPADLPPGRYFPDIGWVAMHSDLSDPDEIFLAFKSSPFGSYNHSHADQNSFVLYAFGEPLLIDSGYYDWYGSPHDKGWTRQTRAHNAVLVNGSGQPIFDLTAKGRILRHFSCPVADLAVGDATAAYKGLLKQARRTIFYLRPGMFLIVDDLEAPAPSTFNWVIHAEKEMELRPEAGEILVRRGAAQCLVKFLVPEKLVLTQTDQFDPPPTTRPNEWHAQATTQLPVERQRFITIVAPFRPGDAIPRIVWNGTQIVCTAADSRDEMTLDLSGDEVSLTAGGTRESGGYSFHSAPAGNVAMLFATTDGKQQVMGVWRDMSGPLPAVHDGMEGPLIGNEREWHSPNIEQAANLNVDLILDDGTVTVPMQGMRTVNGGVLAWGTVPAEGQGAFRFRPLSGDAAIVHLGQRCLTEGDVIWLRPGETFSIRGKCNPLNVKIELQSLVEDVTPILAEVVSDPAVGLKIEAEDLTASGGGRANSYSHRTFLSGGKGLETEVCPGQWVEWRFRVDQKQSFALIVKAAVFEENARRLVELDGQPLGGTYRIFQLPNTGGFGAVPGQWQHLRLGTLPVSVGEHVLRFTTMARKANLDYLLLTPMP